MSQIAYLNRLANADIECLNIDYQREEVVQTMTGLDCGTLEVVGR